MTTSPCRDAAARPWRLAPDSLICLRGCSPNARREDYRDRLIRPPIRARDGQRCRIADRATHGTGPPAYRRARTPSSTAETRLHRHTNAGAQPVAASCVRYATTGSCNVVSRTGHSTRELRTPDRTSHTRAASPRRDTGDTLRAPAPYRAVPHVRTRKYDQSEFHAERPLRHEGADARDERPSDESARGKQQSTTNACSALARQPRTRTRNLGTGEPDPYLPASKILQTRAHREKQNAERCGRTVGGGMVPRPGPDWRGFRRIRSDFQSMMPGWPSNGRPCRLRRFADACPPSRDDLRWWCQSQMARRLPCESSSPRRMWSTSDAGLPHRRPLSSRTYWQRPSSRSSTSLRIFVQFLGSLRRRFDPFHPGI